MYTVLIVMLIVVGAVAGFYFYEFEKGQEQIWKLETELHDLKHLKTRTETILEKDRRDEFESEINNLINAYKMGANPYTTLTKISDLLINKKELEANETN